MYCCGELLAHVEHVRADGAGRERPLAHRVQILALAEVQRDADDLGAVRLGQPGHGDGRVQAARVREDDSVHFRFLRASERRGRRLLVVSQPLEATAIAAAAAASRQTTRTVSSPAMVPTTPSSLGGVDGAGQRLGLGQPGLEHHQLQGPVDAGQVLRNGVLQARGRHSRRRALGAGPVVGAVGAGLHEAQVPEVAREGGLGHGEPQALQPPPQVFLAGQRDAVDEIEDGGLSAFLHGFHLGG